MKKIIVVLFVVLLASCKETPPQPEQTLSKIVAYVHSGDHGVAGKQIILVQMGDTLRTDSNGLAEFSVAAGKYTVRALEINGGGPSLRVLNFDIETNPGQTTKIDIIDCEACM